MLFYSIMLTPEQSAIQGFPSSLRSKSYVSAAASLPFRLVTAPFKSPVPFKAALDVCSKQIQRNTGQLITCKAGPSGRKPLDGASVQIPQSEKESVRTISMFLVPHALLKQAYNSIWHVCRLHRPSQHLVLRWAKGRKEASL